MVLQGPDAPVVAPPEGVAVTAGDALAPAHGNEVGAVVIGCPVATGVRTGVDGAQPAPRVASSSPTPADSPTRAIDRVRRRLIVEANAAIRAKVTLSLPRGQTLGRVSREDQHLLATLVVACQRRATDRWQDSSSPRPAAGAGRVRVPCGACRTAANSESVRTEDRLILGHLIGGLWL
jgi:hypothetical protein